MPDEIRIKATLDTADLESSIKQAITDGLKSGAQSAINSQDLISQTQNLAKKSKPFPQYGESLQTAINRHLLHGGTESSMGAYLQLLNTIRGEIRDEVDILARDITKSLSSDIIPNITGEKGKHITPEEKEQLKQIGAATRAINNITLLIERRTREERQKATREHQFEFQKRAQENQLERFKVKEESRMRILEAQEKMRKERYAAHSVKGLFGGVLGGVFDTIGSLKPSALSETFGELSKFSKEYAMGKKFGKGARALDPNWTPNENASEGFKAGAAGKGKFASMAIKAAPAIAAVAGLAILFKKTILDPTLKVGKKIVGYFTDIAKQTETLQALFNLIALPFKIIFTLGFVGPLLAFIPVLKEMINWITENKEVIQSISDTLARVFTDVFTEDRMGIVNGLLDRFAGVLQFLADSLATNMDTVNTSNVAAFIATTITAVVGFIQDVLMGIVAFCYSPEGQAFIISMAEGIGKLIGTLVDLLIAMLPIFIEMAGAAIMGIIEGIISTVWKAIANLFDIIDKATGGALTGFVNGILSLANWFIDRINDAIGFINSINPFGQIDKLGRMDMWGSGSVGSNFGTAATNFWNTTNSYSSMFITNNNSISNSDTMRNLMMTGI